MFVFEHGRIIGGDHRQYCSGAYSQTGHDVKAEITFHYYGPPRPTFGEAREQFTTELEGRWQGEEINGVIRRPDRPQFDLQIRLTRRMDLPSA